MSQQILTLATGDKKDKVVPSTGASVTPSAGQIVLTWDGATITRKHDLYEAMDYFQQYLLANAFPVA